ncbi:MAG: hypothetical protein VKN13_04170 [Cyanobacteriota bacterium]|nr:hypothetical protein [Cyanobacteriota bacterium]
MAQEQQRNSRRTAAISLALALGLGGAARANSLSNGGFSLLLLAQGRSTITQVQVLLGSAGALPADQRMKPVSEQFLTYRSGSDLNDSLGALNGSAPAPAAERLLLTGRFRSPTCEHHAGDTFCLAGGMAIPQVPFRLGRFLIALDFLPDAANPDCRGYRPFFAGKGIDWNRHFRWQAYSAADPTRSGACRMVIFGGFPDAFALSADGNNEVGLFVIPRPEGGGAGLTISQRQPMDHGAR